MVRLYDKQADRWDRRRQKRTMDTRWRRQLLADARGEVLEIAVGAGGNFPFYDASVRVTAVDISPEMVARARNAAAACGITAECMTGDIEELDFPARAFDTVVSTLSLCSYTDPESVLARMSRWCKEDGRVLLLEHGRSSVSPLAGLQTILDPSSRNPLRHLGKTAKGAAG